MKWNFVLAMIASGIFALAQAEEKRPILLKPVTVNELQQAIDSHSGKVVVVDIWAEFCLPCKKKFPKLVKLHEELQAKGLVILTVTIDDREDREKALEFLKKQNATFTNLHLIDDEAKIDAFQKELATNAPPIIHVFDRKGNKSKSFETGIKDDEVEKLIRDLVAQK